MGWDGQHGQTRAELIGELTANKEWTGSDGTRYVQKVLAHKSTNTGLWLVMESNVVNGKTETIIVVYLIKTNRGLVIKKGMTESMGPAYYDCPLAFLDMAPEPKSEWAASWRAKVRQWHTDNAAHKSVLKSIAVGQTVKLARSRIPQVTITSVKPLMGEYNGVNYRIPKTMVTA